MHYIQNQHQAKLMAYVKNKLLIKDQMDSLMNLFETVIADYKRR